jgi:cytochrome c5
MRDRTRYAQSVGIAKKPAPMSGNNELMRIVTNPSTVHVTVALVAFVWCFVTGMTRTAAAQSTERSGKQVVDALCVSCHGPGAGGAPKIGDRKAWANRAAKGLSGLSSSALAGIRQMPAHGGNMTLTDVEVERAIAYMVNQSGGNWTEPVSRTTPTPPRSGKEIVEAQCIKCHGTGAGGAPKIGDRAAWTQRAKQGFDAVVASAIRGHGAMPPRGGMADLTDPEIRSAIAYMLNPGAGATR